MKRFLLLVVTFLFASKAALAQSNPTGNDNQGSVTAPGGTYSVTPNASQINAYTGDATRVVEDLHVPSVSPVGLDWIRYDSTRIGVGTQWMGNGGFWRYSFQWDFSVQYNPQTQAAQSVQVIYPDDTYNIFTQTSPNVWTSTSAVTDYIVQNGTTFSLVNSKNFTYTFVQGTQTNYGDYYLSTITDNRGQVTRFTYGTDPNGYGYTYPTYITEPGGRYIKINYTDYMIKRVQTVFSGGGNTNIVPAGSGTTVTPQTNGNSNTVYGYVPYISSVSTSDGRTVTYSYTTTNTQTVDNEPGETITTTFYYNAMTKATYSDSTAATYTYSNPNPIELLTASDVRASGNVPNIEYSYYSGASVPSGDVSSTSETTGGSTITTVSVDGGDSQSPVVTYPDGSLYNYAINAGGLASSVENSLSAFNDFAYSSSNGTWTTTTTDANGNPVAITRTPDGKLLTRVWPKVGSEPTNPVETWTYDDNDTGSLISYTDTLGHTVTLTRDQNTELVTKVAYPDGTNESFTYNSFGEPLTHTRKNGKTENFTYDSTGLLQTEQDAAGNTTSFTYDSNYRVSKITDPRTNSTSFTYDDFGRTKKITHGSDGTYQSFTYDTVGDLLTKTDENGNTTTYTYDAFQRVLTMKDALNRTTTYAYDPKTPTNKSPITTTLPSGKKVTASYVAGWGYQANSVTTAAGTSSASVTQYTYDPAGNINSIIDPLSHKTQFTYDARERKATAEDPAGNTSMFYYDDACNLLSEVTPAGTSAMTYDHMNRMLTLNDAKNQKTSYSYDPEGKLFTFTDPNSHVYSYGYDNDERQLSTKYPDSSLASVTYDSAGNVATSTTRDGKVQTITSDARNRPTYASWNDGVTLAVTTAYDSASRITSVSNSNSAVGYTYDAANDVLSETQNVTGLGAKVVTYTYTSDAVLNTLTYPDSTKLTYGYDNANRVSSITQGASTTVVGYTYDANGNRTNKNLANGVNSTLTYDNAERLTSISDLTPSPTAGTLLQKFQYGYDSMSRRTYVKRDNGVGDVYGYDADSQLTSVKYNCTNPDTTPTNPSETTTFTYDPSGNRTQTVDSLNGTTNCTPTSDNQYSAVGGNSATYDGRGNLTSLAGCNYTYDAQNRLTQYTDNLSNSVTQAYDPLGRCVKRVADGVTTYFVYDNAWRNLVDYNSSGTQVNRYVNGPSPNEIVTKTDNSSNVYYYHTDGLGSITKLTSTAGALLEQYSYDVYGKTTIRNSSGTVLSSSSYNNRFMYTGAEYVSPTGLYSMRDRFYSPSLGRFIQPDPIGHSGDNYNIYRYCGNGPTNATDPSGENPGIGITIALNTNGGGGGGSMTDPYGDITDYNTGGLGSPDLGFPTDPQVNYNADGSPEINMSGYPSDSTIQGIQGAQSTGNSTGVPVAGTSSPLDPVEDFFGKIWALPATIIGLIAGGIDYIAGVLLDTDPQVNIANNAIQFTNLPFGVPDSAVTLGNSQLFTRQGSPDELTYANYLNDGSETDWGTHEEAHTYQYEVLGLLFVPVWLIEGGETRYSPASGLPSPNPLERQADLYGEGRGGFWPMQW
jgi:RHS repeat-associated protein